MVEEENFKYIKKKYKKKKLLIGILISIVLIFSIFIFAFNQKIISFDLFSNQKAVPRSYGFDFGDAEYVELLVKTSDNIVSKKDKLLWTAEMIKEDRRAAGKQGYIVDVQREGYEWGNLEKDPKRFAIIKILAKDFNSSWLEPEYNHSDPIIEHDENCINTCVKNKEKECEKKCEVIAGYNLLTERKYRIPLDSFLNETELTNLKSIPYNEKEIRPAIKKTIENISDKIIAVDWDDKPEEIKLHGSSGTFTICPSGCNYTSLVNWETAEDADLTGTGACIANITTAYQEVGINGSTVLNIDGWTTTPADYIAIIVDKNARHDGKWNDTAFMINATNSHGIYSNEVNLVFDGLQITRQIDYARGNYTSMINHASSPVGYNFLNISNVIGKATGNLGGSTGVRGLLLSNTNVYTGNFTIYNNIMSNVHHGYNIDDMNTTIFANNIAYNCSVGFRADYNQLGRISVINSASVNTTDDFSLVGGTASWYNISFCASDDGDGTANVTGVNWATTFVNPAILDFHLQATDTNLTNKGADLSYIFTTDIDYQTRTGTWDIGADEYVSGVTDNAPVSILSSPVDNNSTGLGVVTFECNATDDYNLANVTLYVWNSSGGIITTNFTSWTGTTNSTTFTYNFTFYNSTKWNCFVYDNKTQGVWATNRSLIITTADSSYPIFSSYYDNNASFNNSGVGKFNVTVENTNGTVWLEINGRNVTASNTSGTGNVYNVSYFLDGAGAYPYRWWAYGNGTSKLINNSGTRSYTVNLSSVINYTGMQNVSQNISNGTATITIPTNSNFAILGVAYYANPDRTLNMTLDGQNAVLVHENVFNSGYNHLKVYYFTGFTTGSKTFVWNWSGSTPLAEGGEYMILFFSGVNTTDPIRSNSSVWTTSVSQIWRDTPSVNSSDSDVLVGFASGWSLDTTYRVNMSTTTQTERIVPAVYNDAYYDVATKTGVLPSTTMTANLTQGGLIAVSLRAGNITAPTADTTAPYFTTIPANATLTYKTALDVIFTGADETTFGSYAVNDTRFTINSTGGLKNNTVLGVAVYVINITINDSLNNLNSTLYQVNVTQATLSGSLINNTALTLTYPNPFNFSISESNSGDADVVYKVFRNDVDVSSENNSNIVLGVGSYNFTLNSTGGQNYSANSSISNFTLTISQNTTYVLSLSLSPSATVTYPTETTATGSGCPAELVCNLSLNTTGIVTNPHAITLGVGVYNYTYNTTGNTNYSITTASSTLTVSQNTSAVIYTYLNNSRQNITIYNNTAIWLNATLFNVTGTIYLYKNETLINSGTSPLSNLTDFNGTGIYNITATYLSNTNYSGSSETWWVNVTPTIDSIYPTFGLIGEDPVGTAVYYSDIVFASEVTNTNGTVGFEINGINYTATNIFGDAFVYYFNKWDLGVGNYTYYWWAYGSGQDKNYNVSEKKSYNVTQATGVVQGTINGTQGNFTAINGTGTQNIYINATNITGYGSGKIYVNGTSYNAGTMPLFNVTNLSVGFYNITFEYDGNTNYSSSKNVWWVNVTSPIADTTAPYFTNLANKTIKQNGSLNFDINANDDYSSVDCFGVNDTTNFKIDCNGILKNNTLLSNIAIYWLNISVNDTLGNTNYGIMFVNVTELVVTPPSTGGASCRYKLFGYWNDRLPFFKESGCT